MMTRLARSFLFLMVIWGLVAVACNLPANQANAVATPTLALLPSPVPVMEIPTATLVPATATVMHIQRPSDAPPVGKLVYDVESADTAAEKRAPYGDSYNINRLERPFQQDMTYIPDLDIVTFMLSQDDTYIYVSLELSGFDPNNPVGINYGVEIDLDADGFGDRLIWAHPPYVPGWTTDGVQVFEDSNHDTGGLSGELSDAPLPGNGYDRLLFDSGVGEDPDLAWVRVNAGRQATVQFAFKHSLTDGAYMLGVLADAGLKEAGKLDYVDRFTEEQAGSPEKSEKYYPLKALHSVDNTCREAFGFKPNGYEPQLCPRDEATPKPRPTHSFCPPPITMWCNWDPIECRCR